MSMIFLNSEGKVIDGGDTSGLLGHNEPAEVAEEPNEAQQKINHFWPQVMDEMKRIKSVEPGNQLLPLARIKKIMKLDEDVKMISAEAPLLFAKAAEVFIQELTHRAWLHTDDNKRRTLQRNDIAMAITKYDMFDFLVDIVPRDEIKPQPGPSSSHSAGPSTSTATSSSSSMVKKEPLAETTTKTVVNNDQIHYYLQLAQQQQQQQQQALLNNGNLTTQLPQGTIVQQSQLGGQNIILTSPHTTTIQQQPQSITIGGNQMMQLMQLPTGEVAQIPIQLTQQQLQSIYRQMQMQQIGQQQPIIIQQPQMQPIMQSPGTSLFMTQQQLQHHLQQQQVQQQQVQQQQQQIQQIQSPSHD